MSNSTERRRSARKKIRRSLSRAPENQTYLRVPSIPSVAWQPYPSPLGRLRAHSFASPPHDGFAFVEDGQRRRPFLSRSPVDLCLNRLHLNCRTHFPNMQIRRDFFCDRSLTVAVIYRGDDCPRHPIRSGNRGGDRYRSPAILRFRPRRTSRPPPLPPAPSLAPSSSASRRLPR